MMTIEKSMRRKTPRTNLLAARRAASFALSHSRCPWKLSLATIFVVVIHSTDRGYWLLRFGVCVVVASCVLPSAALLLLRVVLYNAGFTCYCPLLPCATPDF